MKAVDGSGDERVLVDRGLGQRAPTDWSPDGRFILYVMNPAQHPNGTSGRCRSKASEGRFRSLKPQFNETNAQFSPDGRWIAYQSDESGRVEIYVQPFRGAGRKVRVSGSGGVQVRWRRDGKELFFLASDNQLMAIPIRLDAVKRGHRTRDSRCAVPDTPRRHTTKRQRTALHGVRRRATVSDGHSHGSVHSYHRCLELEATAVMANVARTKATGKSLGLVKAVKGESSLYPLSVRNEK